MTELFGFLPAPVVGWVVLALAMIVIELMTMGLTTIWAAGGALAAAAISFFTDSILWQSFIFVLVTLALLLITRPLVSKKVNDRAVSTNVNALIGQKTVAETEISDLKRGEVKIEGKVWSAVSDEESEPIEKGDFVQITGVKGVTLIVKKEV